MVSMSGWKELKAAAGWWVLGVVIGGLSGDATGALAGLWPLLLAASLGGALAALAAAAVLSRGQSGVDAKAFQAQEEWIGELADQFSELEADVRPRHRESVTMPLPPGMERVQ
jgi:hypothetical protein